MGTVDVTTSVLVPMLVVVVWVAAAVDLTVLRAVYLSRESYQLGFVWQLVTWPFADVASVRTAIGLFFFWSFGRILEEPLGPGRFLRFLGLATFIVGILALVIDRAVSTDFGAKALGVGASGGSADWPILFGPRLAAMGVAACVAWEFPGIRAFFGIPIRALVAAFVAIEVLQYLTERDWLSIVYLALTIAVYLSTLRAFGMGSELPSWIPRMPLPAKLTGAGGRGRSTGSKPSGLGSVLKRGGGSKRSGSVVTGPWGEQGTGTASPAASGVSRNTAMTRADREEVDRLLDKIAQDGMGSLSSEERAQLEDASRRLRESEGR